MRMILRLFLASLCCFHTLLAQNDRKGDNNGLQPSLQDSLTSPIITTENRSILLTCVVRNLGNYTLLWKYGTSRVLTAGTVRLTSDSRYKVIHDEGGDVFVLQINPAQHNDTGLYVCEVNTDPPLRSFHRVTVLSDKLIAPAKEEVNTTAVENLWGYSTTAPINHNYTQCCQDASVPTECLGFCSIKNILEGSTGIHPTQCDPFFSKIVYCMADGRNHVPCCERNQVPDVCQDMCVGQYTMQTDDVRTHLSCGSFTAPTLACIAEGIDTLPSRPAVLDAENVTDTSFILRWSHDQNSVNPVTHYKINVTLVADLKHPEETKDHINASYNEAFETKTYQAEGKLRKYALKNLRPFGLYNVTMVSENSLGQSLPSYTLRVLTLSLSEAKLRAKQSQKLPGPPKVPEIPDTKQCCRNKNVTHASCVDTFCDPLSLHKIAVPDVIICAPWGKQMFGCVSDHKDHTECCQRRDVPEECLEICSGQELDTLSYKHFKCVEHMREIANCMISGYNVLPSEPRDFRFSNVGTNIGILHWDLPTIAADSIESYKVTYTLIKPGKVARNIRDVKNARKSPYILEDLQPDSSYEVYVQAKNFYGFGDPSTRIVFRTAKSKIQEKVAMEEDLNTYNQKKCCQRSGVTAECIPMCQYNASLSEVRKLTNMCKSDLPRITKCAAGGRDHLPCCARRGVSSDCQMLCQGVQYTADHSIFTKCMSYVGNIMMCLEEGVDQLPGPVQNFHATYVDDERATFVWDPVEDTADQYEVYYKRLENNTTPASAFEHDASVNVTEGTSVTIGGLTKDSKYQFFVVARNSAGTSLPSSVLSTNISQLAWDGEKIVGKPSAPHGIEILKTTANMLSFAWTAPIISDHEDLIKYRLVYGKFNDVANINSTDQLEKTVISVETWSTTLKLFSLEPNTQYVAYLEAISTKTNMTSEPSETIIAWTDPIVPAFAESPAVHPNEGLKEGDSMTVLCIALGTPTPMVTLYLGSHPIRSEKSRHMVTAIHNITRDMKMISCYADNGFGTPMRASRTIRIERSPRIKIYPESKTVLQPTGSNVRIECEVDAWPAPTIGMGRSSNKKLPDNTNTTSKVIGSGIFKTVMTISEAKVENSGDYYCRATNEHGQSTENNIRVVINSPTQKSSDMMKCCQETGVRESCLGTCSFNLDLDFLLFDSECVPDFNKVMACGSDGSDHRHCCSHNGVPRTCLDWCRGLPTTVENAEICALSHAKTIAKCFHEGQYALPGRPQNIRVTPTSGTSAVVKWDPPVKNPEVVELYRILWRAVNSVRALKVDTSRTKITIENLKPGIAYELVIKAGNANGTSQLTQPLKFITADEYIIETQRSAFDADLFGILFAITLIGVVLGIGVWYYNSKRKLANGVTSNNSSSTSNNAAPRSFENPYFNQEVTMSNLQANDVSGATMSEAMDNNVENDEIPMDDMESNEQSSSSSSKWPKFNKFNNGFGFQRFN